MITNSALSRVLRYDGSYFYIIELGNINGLYKYMLVNWEKNHLGEPIIIYSHTKRSLLTDTLKEFFDNNLLNPRRLERYLSENNLYIGGVDRLQNQPIREYKEGIIKRKNYKTYKRNNNYILIENINDGELKSYNINEFVNRGNVVDFESSQIFTEKDLFNMESETDFVINELLNSERVKKKIETSNGYVGTVVNISGQLKKVSNEVNLEKFSKS